MATRPISTWTFVRAKFEMAALSTLVGWSVAGLALLLWIALGGHAAEMADSLRALRQRHPGSSLWIGLALLIVGAVVMTWLSMVQGLWMGLAGRAWVKAMPALGLIFLISVLLLGQWLTRSPQNWQRFSDLLPWLAGAAVALKAVLALRVSQILVRRSLIATNIFRGALAIWILCAAGLFNVLYWLLPRDHVSVSALVLVIALFLPLTQLLLAPLALAWNRHR